MKLTKEQAGKFDRLSRELIKFLNDNCHPHTHITINSTSAELSEGVCVLHTKEYIKD